MSTLSSFTASVPVARVTVLPNLLRVATVKTPGPTASVSVQGSIGSRFENEPDSGVANLVAQLAYSGTVAKPGVAFANAAKAIGAALRVRAGRDNTAFEATVQTKNVAAAVGLLADAVNNAAMEESAIQKAKQNVLLGLESQSFKAKTLDLLHGTAFLGTNLAGTVEGNHDTVPAITRDQLLGFKSQHYTPNRLVVVGAGNIDHDSFVETVSKAFPQNSEPRDIVLKQAVFTGSDVRVRFDDWGRAYIAIGYATAGRCDPSTIPLLVAKTLLGNWTKNHSAQFHSQAVLDAVFDPVGIQASAIQGFFERYCDTGLFGVYAQTDDPYAYLALCNNLMDSLTRLSYEIDPPKLAGAKTQLLRDLFSEFGHTDSIANVVAQQLLSYGRVIHPSETLSRVEAVDAGAVKLATRRFLNDTDHAMATMGAIHEVQDYGWFRRKSYWLKF